MLDHHQLVLGVLWTVLTGHPDAVQLRAAGERHGVPAVVVWAIAYQESRHNTNPRLQGWHCRGQRNCEWGRFQVRPSTAKLVCPENDIRVYEDNVDCGVRYLAELYRARRSWPLAIRGYQCPSCRRRTPYERDVLSHVGRYTLTLSISYESR